MRKMRKRKRKSMWGMEKKKHVRKTKIFSPHVLVIVN